MIFLSECKLSDRLLGFRKNRIIHGISQWVYQFLMFNLDVQDTDNRKIKQLLFFSSLFYNSVDNLGYYFQNKKNDLIKREEVEHCIRIIKDKRINQGNCSLTKVAPFEISLIKKLRKFYLLCEDKTKDGEEIFEFIFAE